MKLFTINILRKYLALNTKFPLDFIEKKIEFFLLKKSKLTILFNYQLYNYFFAITSFYILFAMSLVKGGRWDMYEPIAVADRAFAKAYSTGAIDGYLPSTPYYPIVSIIAFFVNFISTKYQVEIMLFMAVSLIYVLLYALFKFYKLTNGRRDFMTFFSIGLGFLFLLFNSYLDYAIEFKPDTIALIFLLFAFIKILESKNNLTSSLLIIFYIFTASISKQQIIAPIIGLVTFIIFSKEQIKIKFINLFNIFIGVLLANFFIFFLFEGSFFYAVKSHMGRKLIYEDFYENHKYFLLIITSVISLGILLNREFAKNYLKNITKFIPAIFFILAGIIGAINMGGNKGNSEVGFILILPLLIMSFDYIKKFPTLLILILLSSYNIHKIYNNNYYSFYQNRLQLENTIAEKIKSSGLKSILISGDSYIIARKSEIEKISEIDVWSHILIGVNKNLVPSEGNHLIKDLNPDIILCVQGCKVFDYFYKFDPTKFNYKEIKIDNHIDSILFFKKQQTN